MTAKQLSATLSVKKTIEGLIAYLLQVRFKLKGKPQTIKNNIQGSRLKKPMISTRIRK